MVCSGMSEGKRAWVGMSKPINTLMSARFRSEKDVALRKLTKYIGGGKPPPYSNDVFQGPSLSCIFGLLMPTHASTLLLLNEDAIIL